MLAAMMAMLTKLVDYAENGSWLGCLLMLASYACRLCYNAMHAAHACRYYMLAVLLGDGSYALWLSCLPMPMAMLTILDGYFGYPG
jgi:hypothetical protein